MKKSSPLWDGPWRLYAFELSGEHDTLPEREAVALLELHSGGFRTVASLDQCLVVEARDLDLGALGRRLAMTHRIIEVMTLCEAGLPEIRSAVEAFIEEAGIPRLSYRVRVRGVKQAPLKGYDVEKAVGGVLYRHGYRADLGDPDMEIRGLISGRSAVLGTEVVRVDRGGFEERRPHLKPFFYPGVLMPRMARALVNLARTGEGETLLDPFSGTGGIMVEACLAGLKAVGLDVQEKLVKGARSNLVGLDAGLLVGDARRLPFGDSSVECVVTDPPYGRSALIRGGSKDLLLADALSEVHRVLKPGRRLVVAADRPVEDLLKDAGLPPVERHADRVHKSLTRHIYVCVRV